MATKHIGTRKGFTAQQLADKFGVTARTIRTYTSIPRAEYLATHTISRDKPWESEGVSRRTWYYRKKKNQSQS